MKLKRFLPEEEQALFKAYDLLSKAGFDIMIEDGAMCVWHTEADMELDAEEGIVLIPEDYREEYDERQNNLHEEEEMFF